ncbi:MAG: class I SAM-dependent methyltransferase [Desulfobacterales bacterium]|nr:class I SAM-dependent methyltransferase [Desulfobacterales bacterium]
MSMTTLSGNVRQRLNAWLLHQADNLMDRIYGARKRFIYSQLPSTVVEIGPGAGANLRYYAPHTRVIAIEPNRAMHPVLKARARRYGLDLEIRTIKGESIDLPDQSVSAVVGSLVLCSVDDPARVLSEVRRILEPGGRYIFLEHVAALPGTRLRGLQHRLLAAWRWLFDGCHLNRDTHLAIRQAGFSNVDMDCFMMRSPWLPFAPHIFGRALN